MNVLKPWLVLIATLAFVGAPLLTPGFGGFDPDLFPVPQISPPVQPAGWAFAIWGLIYLWLVVSAFFGVIARPDDAAWTPVRGPLAASLAIGSIWLLVAMQSPVWATALIWAMLILAVVAMLRLPKGHDRWLLEFPVALYTGWLSAAACVSLGLLGAGYGIGPGGYAGQTVWAVVAILLALVLASFLQSRPPRSPAYTGAVIWALVAITEQNRGENWSVAALAVTGIMLLVYSAVRGDLPKWLRKG